MAIEDGNAFSVVVHLEIIFENEIDDVGCNSSEEEDEREIFKQGRACNIFYGIDEILFKRTFGLGCDGELCFVGPSVSPQNDNGDGHEEEAGAIGDGQSGDAEPSNESGNEKTGGDTAESGCGTDEVKEASSLANVEGVANGIPNDDISECRGGNEECCVSDDGVL